MIKTYPSVTHSGNIPVPKLYPFSFLANCFTFSLGSDCSNFLKLVSTGIAADNSDETASSKVSMVYSYSIVIILARSTDL